MNKKLLRLAFVLAGAAMIVYIIKQTSKEVKKAEKVQFLDELGRKQ